MRTDTCDGVLREARCNLDVAWAVAATLGAAGFTAVITTTIDNGNYSSAPKVFVESGNVHSASAEHPLPHGMIGLTG